jgi:L-amino acid N-acyltransferase YncA
LLIALMTADDWPEVRRIYVEGLATGDATLETHAPEWVAWHRGHRPEGRLVARTSAGGPIVGWVALSLYSSRRVYEGVAWESVYVAAESRGQGVGRALLEALIPVSESIGVWTLLAGVMAENAPSLALHERGGFVRVGVQHRVGQDATGRWRDVVLLERRSLTVGA